MVHLRYLVVKSYNEDELLKIDAVDSAPPDLEKLVLARKLEKLPSWFNSLDNLTYLCLHWSSLRNDFLPHIQALPNLGEITLLNAYEGERLDFLEGFQKLKILRINGCCRLNGIVINRGVMPGLQDLYIFDCPEFTTLPHGWKSLPDLKQVRQFDVSPELMEKIWRSERMVRRTIRGINFTRQEESWVSFGGRYSASYLRPLFNSPETPSILFLAVKLWLLWCKQFVFFAVSPLLCQIQPQLQLCCIPFEPSPCGFMAVRKLVLGCLEIMGVGCVA
ncbi:hypothetical protein V6N11_007463 [Hibiscus sabdariffa]|uniref:Disease resistance R13L4/SHOC-2-like LRR domain-containing protein n=1 Tax=Hibiscus sabdariffa TaxID=183260 RepID=A0ABR2NS54_9ROSI